MTRVAIECVCGHALSSHQQDLVDLYISQRCRTCGCAGFENRDEAKMRNRDEEDEEESPHQHGYSPADVLTYMQDETLPRCIYCGAAAPREASEPLRNAGEVMRNGPSKAASLPDELPFSVAPREASEPPST